MRDKIAYPKYGIRYKGQKNCTKCICNVSVTVSMKLYFIKATAKLLYNVCLYCFYRIINGPVLMYSVIVHNIPPALAAATAIKVYFYNTELSVGVVCKSLEHITIIFVIIFVALIINIFHTHFRDLHSRRRRI